MGAYFPAFMQFQQMLGQVSPQEEEIAAQLGRARFHVYGTDVPPDATFSLRLADGVVSGYEYNGTRAPYQTTFYGLYDHYHSYAVEGPDNPWYLPERWKEVGPGAGHPPELRLDERHHRGQLGLSRGEPGPGGRGTRLRRKHREPPR